jgi:hypothetical protein
MKLSDFNTLAEAQAYTETVGKIINRDTMNNILALSGVYIRFKEIATDNTHPHQNILAAFLDSQNYNFIIGNDTGDAQISVLDGMIAADTDISTALSQLKPILLSKANTTTFPFSDATQEQFDSAKALLAIEKQECTYPQTLAYIQTASNQGVDVEITTDVDCAFSVFLSVCSDKLDPEDFLNYRPVNGDRAITYAVSSVNNRLLIELSSRKMRGYNKLYVKPSAVCNFTAIASTNRG